MNNTELMEKIENIMSHDNFCDMAQELFEFNAEYVKSDFYKNTKMKLTDFISFYRQWQMSSIHSIFAQLQKEINALDLTRAEELINQFDGVMQQALTDNAQLLKDNKIREVVELLTKFN